MEKNESPKVAKVAKKTKKAEADIAKQKAKEARLKIAAARNIQPGTVIGGDLDLWVYYRAPADGSLALQYKLQLEGMGYEPCVDGEKMAGMEGGVLYRCPREIADERALERASKR